MKKYALLVVIITFASYNLLRNEEKEMSELVLANVEALSENETETSPCMDGGGGCLNGLWFPYKREKQWD